MSVISPRSAAKKPIGRLPGAFARLGTWQRWCRLAEAALRFSCPRSGCIAPLRRATPQAAPPAHLVTPAAGGVQQRNRMAAPPVAVLAVVLGIPQLPSRVGPASFVKRQEPDGACYRRSDGRRAPGLSERTTAACKFQRLFRISPPFARRRPGHRWLSLPGPFGAWRFFQRLCPPVSAQYPVARVPRRHAGQ